MANKLWWRSRWWRNTKVHIWLGWVLFWSSIIGWPVSAFTVAKGEPPIILAISWLALAYAGLSAAVAGYAEEAGEENSVKKH